MTIPGQISGVVYSETSPYLQRYLKAQVTLYYHPAGGGISDTGHISYIDNFWLELTKDNGDVLLVPINSLRIVKVLQPNKLPGDAGILLRAAEPLPEDQRKQITRE